VSEKQESMANEALSLLKSESLSNNKLRDGFISLAEGLLSNISTVFPECDETTHALSLFRVVVKGDESREDAFVRKCTGLFKANCDGMKARDSSALFAVAAGIPLLSKIAIDEKWADPDFTDESKNNMWQYLEALDTFGNLYCAVPSRMMSKIEEVASGFQEQLKSGSFDLSKFDVNKISEDIMTGLSAEDMRQFEQNLPEVYSCVSTVAKDLAKQAGHDSFDPETLMSQLAAGIGKPTGGGGGADIGELMGKFANLIPSGALSTAATAGGCGDAVAALQQLMSAPQIQPDVISDSSLPAPPFASQEAQPATKQKKKKNKRHG
jgi:hypothetical protein